MAALNGLEYSPLEANELNYSSVTNHRLNILGRTTCFIKLEKICKPIRISFLVCGEDGDEAILSLDTLVELSIVPPDFPCPMNAAIRDHKISRINEVEEVEEINKEEKTKWGTIKQRIDSLRSQLSFPQENKKEDMEEEKCEALKQSWLKDFSQVFKEDLTIEDRIDMEPVKIKLVENHKDIPVHHPNAANQIPAYLRAAADKELNRMIAGGLLEKVEDYSETVSRGFFVPKKTAPGEETKVRLVADFRGVNLRLQRPEYPLDSSSSILKRLNPGDRFFAAIDMSSGYSQIPLDEDSRNMFTIILPQGKYRFCVLPQGLSVSPEIFDLSTAP